jgi:integrase
MVRTGATFRDAAEEWLRYVEHDRGRKPSTLADYRSAVNAHLIPAFGEISLERVTTETIERWISAKLAEGRLSRRSVQKMIVLLNGVFRRARRVWGLTVNPVADVERLTVPARADIDFYSPEELHTLVRAADGEQDAAIYLTAALTGLRMGELLALRWRDVDFAAESLRVTASFTAGKLGTPKSGHGRVVPLVDEVARALARLGGREQWTGPDHLVFVGELGEHLDGSALRLN